MADKNFMMITISTALIGAILIVTWMNIGKLRVKMGAMYYAIPLIIIITITGILLQQTTWHLDSMKSSYQENMDSELERKWSLVVSQLEDLQQENYDLSLRLTDRIIEQLQEFPSEYLDDQLSLIGYGRDNLIQDVVDEVTKGIYFRNVVADTNDPFALIIGKGEEDSFVFSNHSQVHALDLVTNSMDQEYHVLEQVTGGDTLSRHTFKRILGLETGTPSESFLFLQVKPRPDGEIKATTLQELKTIFKENGGSVKETFEGIEFLAPHYIYRDGSIGGTPRMENRVKTDAKTIGVVSSFGYLSVLENNADLQTPLRYYEKLTQTNEARYIIEMRATLIIGLLVMGIIYVLLILFWIFMHIHVEDVSNS